MSLIPKKHLEYNRYWQGRIRQRERPEDPRKSRFGREQDARASLARFDGRLRSDAHGDPRSPKHSYWGGTLDSQIDWLKDALVIALRLQIIHVAGEVQDRNVLRTGAPEGAFISQNCSECGRRIITASGSWTGSIEDFVEPETRCWKVGTKILERWEGRYVSDHVWKVLEPGEEPEPGFIPCTGALANL